MVPLALGPSLFRSQHVGELRQQAAFFLPSEHEIIFYRSVYPRLYFFHLPRPGIRSSRCSSLDEGERPSHGSRCGHQYDRRCEHQTQKTEEEHMLAHAALLVQKQKLRVVNR